VPERHHIQQVEHDSVQLRENRVILQEIIHHHQPTEKCRLRAHTQSAPADGTTGRLECTNLKHGLRPVRTQPETPDDQEHNLI